METFAKWYMQCHGVTHSKEVKEDVDMLTMYAMNMVKIHLTYHRPCEEKLGNQYNSLGKHEFLIDQFYGQGIEPAKFPTYAQIKHRDKKWFQLNNGDTDCDDYQQVLGSEKHGIQPWFDIRTIWAPNFYVQRTVVGWSYIQWSEGTNRINHLTTLYRNTIVREGMVDYRKEGTFNWNGDSLPDLFDLRPLPTLLNQSLDSKHLPALLNHSLDSEHLPIFAYCGPDHVNGWARLAVTEGVDVLRLAWIGENIWVW
jgi:hypothetical protein